MTCRARRYRPPLELERAKKELRYVLLHVVKNRIGKNPIRCPLRGVLAKLGTGHNPSLFELLPLYLHHKGFSYIHRIFLPAQNTLKAQ